MNAPVSEARLADKLEWLPIGSIAPSETPSQARRRRRYGAEALAELARSIQSVGVMQPIIVRKLEALRGLAAYEVVAGERRWRATEQAGFAHIPAIVRDIADVDLVAFQYIENKQRATIDALEEAESFADLMKDKACSVDDLVDTLGVSRAHVYNRLKLLKLQPAVLDALDAGRIDHTKALQIARIPAAKLQRKALEKAVETDYRGNAISHRDFAEWIRERLMVRMDGTPFPLDDKNMVTKKPGMFACQDSAQRNLPPCTMCENFSGNDADFNAEITTAHGAGALVCTDKPCHDAKVVFFFDRKLETARADGRLIIEGDEAKAVKPWPHSGELRGYIDLDAPAQEVPMPDNLPDEEANAWEPPTYRTLLQNYPEVMNGTPLLVDPHNGQPRDVLPAKLAEKALKHVGIKVTRRAFNEPIAPHSGADDAPAQTHAGQDEMRREQEKQRQREQIELAFRRKLLDQVHAKWKGPLKRDDLQAIADRWLEEQDAMNLPLYDWYYEGRIDTTKMNERELTRILLELALWSSAEYPGDSPTALITVAKRLKIDPAKVRKQAKAELGGEPEAEEKPAPKKKAKKK